MEHDLGNIHGECRLAEPTMIDLFVRCSCWIGETTVPQDGYDNFLFWV